MNYSTRPHSAFPVFSVMAGVFLAEAVIAADITWTNIAGGDWDAPTNWNPNQAPGVNDSASIITPGQYTVTVRGNVTVSRLVMGVEGGSKGLRLQGNNVKGNANLVIGSTFTNWGAIELTSVAGAYGAYFTVSSGTLVNALGSTFAVSAGTGGTRRLDFEWINQGETFIGADTTISRASSQHSNTGTLRLAGGNLTISQTGTSPSAFLGGTLDLASGTMLRISGGTTTLAGEAKLLGLGMLDIAGTSQFNLERGLILSAGTTALGLSGSVTVNGPGAITNTVSATLDDDTMNTLLVNQGTLIAHGSSKQNGPLVQTGLLRIEGSISGHATLTVANGLTNQGAVELTSTNGAYNATLTVNGSLRNLVGSTVSIVPGVGGSRTLNVELDNAGEVVIEADTTMNRSSAQHSNTGTLRLAGGNLTINQTGTLPSAFLGGTLDLAPDTMLRISGGSTTVANNANLIGAGMLDIAGTSQFNLEKDLVLSGTSVQLGLSGTVTVNGPGTITNNVSTVLDDDTINTLLANQGTLITHGNSKQNGLLIQAGVLRIEGSSRGHATLTVANGLTNQGTIELTSTNGAYNATLTVNGPLLNLAGSSVTVFPGVGGTRSLNVEMNNAGQVVIGAETTISRASSQHSNTGTLRLAGGSLTINQTGTLPSAFLGGTLDLAPDTMLRISGGSTTLASDAKQLGGGMLDIAGTSQFNLEQDLVLSGTSVQLGLSGTVTVNGPGTITNKVSTVLDDDTINILLANQGTLIARGSSKQNGLLIQTGVLRIEGSSRGHATLTVANGLTNQGTIELTSTNGAYNATLAVNGTLLNSPTGNLRVSRGTDGRRSLTLELLNLGAVSLDADTTLGRSVVHHWNGGSCLISSGSVVSVSGTDFENGSPSGLIKGSGELNGPNVHFSNSGQIDPGDPIGVLKVTGEFRQSVQGSVNIDIGSLTDYDRLQLNGLADLNGALNVRFPSGYVPNIGDSFNVLTFNSRAGEFCCLSGLTLIDAHVRLDPTYTANGLTLTARNITNPAPALHLSLQGNEWMICWPLEFTAYRLLFATNIITEWVGDQGNQMERIVLTNWTEVPVVAGNRTLFTPDAGNRFFMLAKP